MNLPNKLTMLRVFLIPFFVFFLLVPVFGDAGKWIALGIFIAASLTDLADGKIARKYNLITDFGKFMDPLADKLLVCSAMICLTSPELWSPDRIPAWIVVIIIAREFTISGFRLIAAEKGTVIAAGWWGKWKTTFQMIMVILKIADIDSLRIVANVVMVIALILTVVSLADYLVKNRSVLDGEM
ncbi:MAG: CDP-diacylglycerol--glycerol-3-phosphate 3-phosphatidyltransferase [Lachnospiraceae bacterium]|nr:CDP-diacylglycerol--glycerol-3-phosphate 3-phosphatidyltransferase [Lachnospiraceae bacterium]